VGLTLNSEERARRLRWAAQDGKLERAKERLLDWEQNLRFQSSAIFAREPAGLTIRENLERAWKNPFLNAIAWRDTEANDLLPAGTSPQAIRRRVDGALTAALDAIEVLQKLSRAIGEGTFTDTRAGAIAARIVEIERRDGIQLKLAAIAYLDLAAREAVLSDVAEWDNLRHQWDAAMRRAGEKSSSEFSSTRIETELLSVDGNHS
jgi:hypothetical protein